MATKKKLKKWEKKEKEKFLLLNKKNTMKSIN